MKFNPIFGFIAVFIFLFASSVSAYPDIAGTWYVHNVTGSIWVHHPTIRSWNFTIARSSEENCFTGVTIYVEDQSNEKTVADFNATLYSEEGVQSYHVTSLDHEDITLKIFVEATDKGMDWQIISEEGINFGILALRPEPALEHVRIYFADEDGFEDNTVDLSDDDDDVDEIIDNWVDEDDDNDEDQD